VETKEEDRHPEFPFPVPAYRFNQKNEMFKRNIWDEKNRDLLKRFTEIHYQPKVGYRKIDYAFRNASWALEWKYGMGNVRSNFGLYEWKGVPERIRPYAETGDPVQGSPEEMSRMVKKTARFYGADLVGICNVHPNWIYSHEFNMLTQETYPIDLPEGCNQAVVMAIEMDYEAIRSSPTGISAGATGLGYSKMAFLANMVAIFIRGLGYRAIPAGNDTALSIPLAMAAGLGESSRMGLLITEKYGPRVRLCKVFTDLPLEVNSYRPFGVKPFCETCKKCATRCPSQAISHGEMTTEGLNICNQSGILKWYVDGEKCYSFWAKNRMDCTTCIRVCPFNKGPGKSHDAVRSVIRRTRLFNPLFNWIDSLLGYDRPLPAKKFWDK